jgi:hypothetical protein
VPAGAAAKSAVEERHASCSFANFLQKRWTPETACREKRRRFDAISLARALLFRYREEVKLMNNEVESDVEGYEAPGKGAARRRVDAYHEALRERAALAELEQPFIETRSWPPRRY